MIERDLGAELHDLLAELMESNVSEMRWQRLKQLLAADAEARRTYRLVLMVQSLLERFQVEVDAANVLPAAIPPPPNPRQPRFARAVRLLQRGREAFSRPTPISLTVAALMVGLLITGMAFMAAPFYRQLARPAPVSPDVGAPVVVATLSGLHEPVWAEGQIGQHQGAQLVAGHEMNLTSGLAEITFRKGSRVVLQGPAKFVLQSDNAARLASGKLVARVPTSAVGFEVETSAAVITDLGTEFGVDVQDELVDTHVFIGEVLVQAVSRGGSPSGPVRIGAGEAVRIEADGQVKLKLPADQSRFPRRMDLVNLARGKSIAAASASWSGTSAVDFRYVAEHVVDGKIDDAGGSYWIGRGDTPNEQFTIDLGGEFRIERIELLQTHNGVANDRGTKDFELWASDKLTEDRELVEPQLIASGNLPSAAGTGANLPVFVLSGDDGNLKPHDARYVRFIAKTYHGLGCGLNEIRVFGARPE